MTGSLRIRVLALMVACALVILPFVEGAAPPETAHAQSDVAVDPKSATLKLSDLRPGFRVNPDPNATFDGDRFGIRVYETDFVRDSRGDKGGPVKVNNLIARTQNSRQSGEQFDVSKRALVTADPPWIETTVPRVGDMSAGLSFRGTLPDGPQGIAHLFLFRRGAMVVGVTVTGPERSTKMAEAEALAVVILTRIDPSAMRADTSIQKPRPFRSRPSAQGGSPSGTPTATTSSTSAGTGARIRVTGTGGSGLRLRTQPSLRGSVSGVLPEGTILEVVGADRQADGLVWKNVRAPGDGVGWVAARFTVPVPGSSASSGLGPTGGQTASGTPPATAASFNSGSTSSGSTSSGPPATATRTPTNTPTPTSTSTPTATPLPTLSVDIKLANSTLRSGATQRLTIEITFKDVPVDGAVLSVEAKSAAGSESIHIDPTDSAGKASAAWQPSADSGNVEVIVKAVGPDGTPGSGSATFRIQ
jgi:hypothetical protein